MKQCKRRAANKGSQQGQQQHLLSMAKQRRRRAGMPESEEAAQQQDVCYSHAGTLPAGGCRLEERRRLVAWKLWQAGESRQEDSKKEEGRKQSLLYSTTLASSGRAAPASSSILAPARSMRLRRLRPPACAPPGDGGARASSLGASAPRYYQLPLRRWQLQIIASRRSCLPAPGASSSITTIHTLPSSSPSFPQTANARARPAASRPSSLLRRRLPAAATEQAAGGGLACRKSRPREKT